jgi:hypothetical protein
LSEKLTTPLPLIEVLTVIISFLLSTVLVLITTRFTSARLKQGRKNKTNAERTILSVLTGTEWKLVFDPNSAKGSTKITFADGGVIDQGRNDNENSWRLRDGFLERLNSKGKIFSRFLFDEKKKCFSHTNDDDTLSLRSQRIEPSK